MLANVAREKKFKYDKGQVKKDNMLNETDS